MKQTKTIKKEVEVESTTDIICNLCGESCCLGPTYGDDKPPYSYGGLIEQIVTGGYNSTPGNGEGALDDMTEYSFSLCEFCLDHLFARFVVPPEVHCLIDDKIDPWRPATQRVTEDDWRKTKEKFFQKAGRRVVKRKAK
jgi:hypothetical protein